jgi:hypothetical protein
MSIVKRGTTVITQFWINPKNSLFFQNKNKIKVVNVYKIS